MSLLIPSLSFSAQWEKARLRFTFVLERALSAYCFALQGLHFPIPLLRLHLLFSRL